MRENSTTTAMHSNACVKETIGTEARVTLTASGLLTRLWRFLCNLPPTDRLSVPLFSETSKSSDFTERRQATQFCPSRRESRRQRSTDPSVDGFPPQPPPMLLRRRKCLTRAATLALDGRFQLQISRAFQMQMASRRQLMLKGSNTVQRVQRRCLAKDTVTSDRCCDKSGLFCSLLAALLFLTL